jgi:hypothetical protein
VGKRDDPVRAVARRSLGLWRISAITYLRQQSAISRRRYRIGNATPARGLYRHTRQYEDGLMGKGILLWLIGVPIPLILIGWLVFH